MKPEWSYDIIAPIYDSDMGLNMPFNDVHGYMTLLPAVPAKILEVGCGTGRLTLPLAEHGYSITAIDRSGPMLEQLRSKLTPDHSISALQMDARDISLTGPFDSVFFAYCGFQYLLDELEIGQFCDAVKRVLSPNGSLILDIFLHQKGRGTDGYFLDYERTLDNGGLLSRHRKLSISNGLNTTWRKYSWEQGDENRHYHTTSYQLLYSAESLVSRLDQHGFNLDAGMFDYKPHVCDTECRHRFYTARFIPR